MGNLPVGMVLATLFGCVTSEPNDELNIVEQGVLRTQNGGGWAESISLVNGALVDIDRTNPFFLKVGSNARTCETCHMAREGWTFTSGGALARFNSNGGTGPMFLPHDASNNVSADHSTVEQRRLRYSLVINRGLIQTPQALPSGADFSIAQVDDPYGSSTPASFLRFRRPNSIANERLTQTITWNGFDIPVRPLLVGGSNQAADVHLEAIGDLDLTTLEAMADFMENLVFAQAEDTAAGRLDLEGARGGVVALASETFVAGANDPLSIGFNPNVFTLYGAWAGRGGTTQEAARAAIGRGEVLFNTKQFDISGVAGLNDPVARPVIRGTCSTCHAVPNVGNHPVFRPMDIGTTDRAPRQAELPLLHAQVPRSGAILTRRVTDLGIAVQTGRWDDIGKFSVPRLRGLVSRAPYFHNGFARNLQEVIAFYKTRFNITLTAAETNDLAAFLRAL